MKEKQAIEIMKQWIEYEKSHKEKINKADELIEVQETIVNALEKKSRIIDNVIIEVQNSRQYFSEDLQSDFIRILEILKDKNKMPKKEGKNKNVRRK